MGKEEKNGGQEQNILGGFDASDKQIYTGFIKDGKMELIKENNKKSTPYFVRMRGSGR